MEDPRPKTFPETEEPDCGKGVSVKPPKPKTFPVLVSAGLVGVDCDLVLPNPNPKKPDSCFELSNSGAEDLDCDCSGFSRISELLSVVFPVDSWSIPVFCGTVDF